MNAQDWSLFDTAGRRKYADAAERRAILAVSRSMEREDRTLVQTLVYTGARPTELVGIEAQHIDIPRSRVILKTAKQRGKVKHRAVPVPPELIDALDLVHDLRAIQRSNPSALLWPRTRQHVWNVIAKAVAAAGVPDGPHASPKGLRHGFAIACLEAKIDPFTVQRWMGHTYVTTTQVYAQLVGTDEDTLAASAWASLK